eukprot:6188676-Pleurochrysis_carterae.AAC.2
MPRMCAPPPTRPHAHTPIRLTGPSESVVESRETAGPTRTQRAKHALWYGLCTLKFEDGRVKERMPWCERPASEACARSRCKTTQRRRQRKGLVEWRRVRI